MIEGYRIAPIPLHFPEEREQLRAFLARHQLRYESDIQSAFGIYNEEDVLVGCGCAAGYLMKCFAVEPDLRGAECAWTSGFLFDAGALFCRIL